MLNAKFGWAVVALGGAVMIGCEKETTSTPAAPSTPGAQTTADKAMDQAKQVTGAAADKAAAGHEAVTAAAADAHKTATDTAAGALDAVKKELGEDPQAMLDKAMAFVKENKLADAKAILTKLEGVSSKLPAEWAGKISSLKSAIETAEKAAGALPANLPGMGK